MYCTVSTEILNKINEDNYKEIEDELNELRLYTNRAFVKISKRLKQNCHYIRFSKYEGRMGCKCKDRLNCNICKDISRAMELRTGKVKLY